MLLINLNEEMRLKTALSNFASASLIILCLASNVCTDWGKSGQYSNSSDYSLMMKNRATPQPDCEQTCSVFYRTIGGCCCYREYYTFVGTIVEKLQNKSQSCTIRSLNNSAYVSLNVTYLERNALDTNNRTIWDIWLNKKNKYIMYCDQWPTNAKEHCKESVSLKTFLDHCSKNKKYSSDVYDWIADPKYINLFHLQYKEIVADNYHNTTDVDTSYKKEDIKPEDSEIYTDDAENDSRPHYTEFTAMGIGLGITQFISIIIIILLFVYLNRLKQENQTLRKTYESLSPEKFIAEAKPHTLEDPTEYSEIQTSNGKQAMGEVADNPSLTYETVEIKTVSLQSPEASGHKADKEISVMCSVPNKNQPQNPSKRVLASKTDDIIIVENDMYGTASPEVDIAKRVNAVYSLEAGIS